MNKASIIKKPVVSERSLLLAQNESKYTFLVSKQANKHQIKAAIEAIYGVDVQAVNTNTGYSSKKSTGKKRMPVVVAPNKKAVVTLPKSQTISVFEFGESNAN
jgi:large subunit ribosomal protein L23